MKMEDIDRVAKLRNDRQLAERLVDAARCGHVGEFTILHEGGAARVFNIISAEPIRAAVAIAGHDLMDKIDEELRSLGVSTPRQSERSPGTAEEWKRTAEMYQRAWLRELGGHSRLLPKRHFIDALVGTTRDLRERVDSMKPAAPADTNHSRS